MNTLNGSQLNNTELGSSRNESLPRRRGENENSNILLQATNRIRKGRTKSNSVIEDSSIDASTAAALADDHVLHCERSEIGFVQSERQLIRNIAIFLIASTLANGSLQAIQNISSSLYIDSDLGVETIALAYFLAAVSVLYAKMLVARFGPNWTFGMTFCAITTFICAHFYATPLALIPSAVFLGVLLGPCQSAQLCYLFQMTARVQCLTAAIRYKLEQRYLWIFQLLLSVSHVAGNLSLTILLYFATPGLDHVYVRTTATGKPRLEVHYNFVDQIARRDQLRSLPQGIHPNLCLAKLSGTKCLTSFLFAANSPSYIFVLSPCLLLLLIGFLVGLTLAAVIIVFAFLHKFDVYVDQDPLERGLLSNAVRSVLRRAIRDNHLRLVLPISFFIGLEQGFFSADFTKSYVSCAVGLSAIGSVMLTRAITHIVGSLLVHGFIQHIQRPLILAAGIVCQAGLLMIIALWKPDKEDAAVFYVTAVGWGLCNAIWETLLLTNIMRCFISEEWQHSLVVSAGFQFLGLATAFSASYYICPMIKVYMIALILPITALPFACAEVKLLKEQKITGNAFPEQL